MKRIIFRQLLDFIPQRTFRRATSEQKVSYDKQGLSAWEQFICMSFAQLTHCNGLRDVEACFEVMSHKVYHLGVHKSISKSSLSRANNKRPSVAFKLLAELLIREAKKLHANDVFLGNLEEVAYVLDSTYISLCLSLFPWGQIGKQKIAGLKIHTLLSLRGLIPSFINVSEGSYPDNKILDQIIVEAGAFYIMDKAYVDFKRLNVIDEQKGYFVVRFKENISFIRTSSNKLEPRTGVLIDQVGKLTGSVGKKKYKNKVRKIVFHDSEKNKTLTFMTNNFAAPAESIVKLYKHRWQIEIFFKWIKQNLKIKKFYGNSFNAVETQIWIAIATYLLVVIAKKRLELQQPLAQILHILSISLFEKDDLVQLLNKKHLLQNQDQYDKQLNLFSFR